MKRIVILTVSIFALIIGLCGCQKSVESSEITFEDMTLTLPDGDWYYGDEENQYVSEDCSIVLAKSDESDYSERINANERRQFEFLSYDDHNFGGYPDCDFMYIDGYVAEFYSNETGLSMMIEYGPEYDSKDYYLVFADYVGDEEAGKEELKEILNSIEFQESGNEPCIGVFWQDAITDIKPELSDGSTVDVTIQGWVSEVTHESGENGKPYYIDIGNSYPDPERVTGVIWEENQNDYDDYLLSEVEDHLALLMGEAYLYDNILNVRIDDSRHVIPIYRVDDL